MHDLSEEEAQKRAHDILTGKLTKSDIKNLLTTLHKKGETHTEIIGFARAMRESMTPIDLGKECLDLCGTGGFEGPRFNLSTSAAFLLASLEIAIAKHGNRGSRKPNGSFDFLEALGIPLTLSIEKTKAIFKETHLAFLFARNHHPAMRHVSEARQELPFRTIFNLLGPLCNPASAKYQVIGTTTKEIAEKLTQALQKLETSQAMIIVGPNGIDELSIEKPSLIYDVTQQHIIKGVFSPPKTQQEKTLSEYCGSAQENAKLLEKIIKDGTIYHPVSEAIALNAAAGHYVTGKAESILKGYPIALEQIRNKSMHKTLENYRNLAQ